MSPNFRLVCLCRFCEHLLFSRCCCLFTESVPHLHGDVVVKVCVFTDAGTLRPIRTLEQPVQLYQTPVSDLSISTPSPAHHHLPLNRWYHLQLPAPRCYGTFRPNQPQPNMVGVFSTTSNWGTLQHLNKCLTFLNQSQKPADAKCDITVRQSSSEGRITCTERKTWI